MTVRSGSLPHISFALLRVGIAAGLMVWAVRRFYGYVCMVPWRGYPNEPEMFIAASLAFFAGFAWTIGEVAWLVAKRLRAAKPLALMISLGFGLIAYAVIAVIVYVTNPSDRYHGQPYYRDRLSIAWVAGILEEFEHYDTPECGY